MNGDDWRRLHPLSPIVRGGRATIALTILILPAAVGVGSFSDTYIQLGIVAALTFLGFVSWLVTRWRVDDDDLRIETGLLRRQSLRFPLAQVQAIDIVRPGLARIFGVAELRLRMGGATGKTARLAYVSEREAEPLRERLLALASGAVAHEKQEEPAAEEVLASVPSGRLAAAILISDVGVFAEAVVVGLIVAAVFAPAAARGIVSGGLVWILTIFTLVWRRFNQEYRTTVAQAPDGLRLRSGLVALTAETIRPGRVQAVRMVEPVLWRRLGWARVEVTSPDGSGRRARVRRSAGVSVRCFPSARVRSRSSS